MMLAPCFRLALFISFCVWIAPRGAQAQEAAAPPLQGTTVPGAVADAAAGLPRLDDDTTTMMLQLKNTPIEQLVQFMMDTTGKTVAYNPQQIGKQITISSPNPVTVHEALELIYDRLLMEDIYVIEQEDVIRIVPGDQIKNMQFKQIGEDEDLQTMPDSREMRQKIYKLKNISAENLKKHLDKFVPETSLTVDTVSNTVVVVDQVRRLKRYDALIQALDSSDTQQYKSDFIELEYTDALNMAQLVTGILAEREGMGAAPPQQGGRQSSSAPTTVGKITIVPEPRLNWLIIYCPPEKLEEVRALVKSLDQPRDADVQMRLIDIKYIDATTLAARIDQLFERNGRRAEKEQIQIVPYEEGKRLIVRSSQENYDLIQKLVLELDTPEAEQRETRTISIQHMQASDLVPQLETLFEDKDERPYWYRNYGNSTQSKPSFVAIARSNSLLIKAKPGDFEFIQKMITELDQPVDMTAFEPKIYTIRHTDANELVKMLESLFKEQKSSSGADYWDWRPKKDEKSSIQQLFGDLRFVVDNVANRIVVLTSHPENYAIMDRLIEKYDTFDPASAEVMVYELEYADPMEVADHINSIFSDGQVQRPQQPQKPADGSKASGSDDETSNASDEMADAIREVFYPWQVNKTDKKEKERPINTMIGKVRVVPDPRTGKLMIASPSMYFSVIKNILQELDQPEPQVNIRTRIMEVSLGDERRIGIHWTPDPSTIDRGELDSALMGLSTLGFVEAFGKNTNTGTTINSGGSASGQSGSGGGVSSSSGIAGTGFGSNLRSGNTILSSQVNLALLIQLLLKNSVSEVIGEPYETVNNNEVAHLFVGSRFPFNKGSQTRDTGATNNQIEYRDIGVTLDIRPQINAKGEVVLKVNLINSSVRDEQINGNLIEDSARLKTEVAMDSEQTMVIGGIVTKNKSRTQRKIPILGSIPWIGPYLFGKKDNTSNERQLVVFITPTVLNSRVDDDALLQRANEQMEKMKEFEHKQ